MPKREQETLPKRRGRPTELTAELADRVCHRLRNAGSISDAALAEGVDRRTLWRWRVRGEQEESGIYRDFADQLEQARAERRLELERLIREKGEGFEGDWKALSWLLTIDEPKRYAQQVRVHVEEELTDAVARIREALRDQPETLERVLDALTRERSSAGVVEAEGLAD